MSRRISTRWFAALGAGLMILVFALSGTGQTAPGASSVRIVDATNQNQAAKVDAQGNLSVTGSVSLNTSTPVAVTSPDDPGRLAFQSQTNFIFQDGVGVRATLVDIPPGMRLVVTYVSGLGFVPSGQTILNVNIATVVNGVQAVHQVVPVSTADDMSQFAQDTMFYSDQDVGVVVVRSQTASTADVQVTVAGYLIDCSVAACN